MPSMHVSQHPRIQSTSRVSRVLSTLLVGCSMVGAAAVAESPDLVDVNGASAHELAEGLHGVGPARASAIVEHREERGAFVQVEDLMEVSGVGPALLEENRDRLMVGE